MVTIFKLDILKKKANEAMRNIFYFLKSCFNEKENLKLSILKFFISFNYFILIHIFWTLIFL